MEITLNDIGIINTPFKTREGMPVQSVQAMGIKGQIVLNKDLVEGLIDLGGFSHIILVYYFHQSNGFELQVTPFFDPKKHGVFSTRAPKRPNSIGISVVKLLDINNNILNIENVDILDGTPLLDIKPYIADFDIHPVEKNGWFTNNSSKLNKVKSDKRFV